MPVSLCRLSPRPDALTPARWTSSLHHVVEPEVTDPRPAVPFRQRDAEEPFAAGDPEQLVRHDAGPLPLEVVRDDLLVEEGTE
jgi:hypothetical protein